jgi:nucleolar protein 14
VRQLGFDRRVTPGDKMKSAEEIAKNEKEKLDKLEEERLKRMKGDLNVSKKMPHRSADDLDDGYLFNYSFSFVIYYLFFYFIRFPFFNSTTPEVKMLSYGMTEQDKSVIPGRDEEEVESENEGEEEEEESDSEEDDDEDDSFSDLASSEDEENDAGVQEPKSKIKKKTAQSKTSKNDEMPFVFKSIVYFSIVLYLLPLIMNSLS